jgi:hypothetical protein
MLPYILIAVAVIVLLIVVVIAARPGEFRVSRSLAMNAPPSAPFAQVNELKRWSVWSPWEKVDPDMKKTYEGPPAGVGATMRWDGDKNIGAGSLTIVESKSGEVIRIRLEFLRPFKATNAAAFTFEPRGRQTLVTWTMTGTHNFMGKAMCLVMNMDKMIGGQFEKGLADMKAIVETPAPEPAVSR